jgi:hypothetical protein
MTRLRIALASAAVIALVVAIAAQSQWYALYDEAVKHIQAGEFQLAETKLQQAKKEGPSSGRNVLRYGSLRQPYFPDYYLGVVYVSTNRPQEALDAFAAARQANIDAKNNEFKLIGTFEGQARTALANAKNNPPANTAKPTGPVVPAPPDPGIARAAQLKEFDSLLATSRQRLEKKDFDGAEQFANSARALSDKQGLGVGQRADQMLKDIGGTRQVGVIEEAINRKDPAAARAAWNLLNAMAPTYAEPSLRARIERLERDATPVPVAPNPPVNAAANVAAAQQQFETVFNTARTQLGQRNYDAAEQSGTNASRLAIKLGLGPAYEQRADALVRDAGVGRRVLRVELAIKNRDVAAARKELSGISVIFPQFDARSLTSQVDRIETENNVATWQRDAMRAFFTGGYQESLSLVARIERTGIMQARTQFYRACSLAALAATATNPAEDKRLAEAKRYYAEAAKTPEQFRDDLRYISPKVKQLLGI